MRKEVFIPVIVVGMLVPAAVLACGIQGTAHRSGSKVDGSVRVATDWNSNATTPRNGYYTLELGSGACGQRVRVYVDGKVWGDVTLPSSGNATVNVTVK